VLPGQESEWSYMCVRIAVFYQARRVSGHICVLPCQESEWSYMCVRIAVFYQASRVSCHNMCVRIGVLY